MTETKYNLFFYSRRDAIELVLRDLTWDEAFIIAHNISNHGIWVQDNRVNLTAQDIEEERERAQNTTWGMPQPHIGMTRHSRIRNAEADGSIERINPSRVEWRKVEEDE